MLHSLLVVSCYINLKLSPLLFFNISSFLLQKSQVNHFNALLHLDLTESEEVFLNMLEGLAYLVQGPWVSKSSLIYDGDEEWIRDYILFLFSQNLVIKKRKLEELKIDDSALRQLFTPLAYERELFDDWKFIEERDFTFIKQHPEVHEKHEDAWKRRGGLLEDYIRERVAQHVGSVELSKSSLS
ncbi:uncharacterized protein A4U43_C05F32490 [Asparagus officinalis]|uniref:Uncharacterized protein n=1 Tax=Asparagus officinalis TaxID=4686 RepID=A0A5P1EW46_ASPOF|nr:uncharacterized protein A4U43_C05F32490 [Asparagus officinalis]